MVIGSGWHPRLFREEAEKIHGAYNAIHPRILEIPSPRKTETSCSLTSITLKSAVKLPLKKTNLTRSLHRWADTTDIEGSFAVRSMKLGTGIAGISGKHLEKLIGQEFSQRGYKVDLENPDTIIRVIISGAPDRPQHKDTMVPAKVLVTGIEEKASLNHMQNSMTSMPFFKPVTLDPALAGVLISLAYKNGDPPSSIVDPFCGTGCIAIQARNRGIPAYSSDSDPTMVEGANRNFSHAFGDDQDNYKFQLSDVSGIAGIWGEKSNTAFVFDPPYARNSKISNDAFEVFASACHAAKRMDPQGTIVTILPSPETGLLDHLKISKRTNVMGVEWGYIHQKLEEIGWGIELAIPTRVHKSLVRIIIRATAISDQE